MTARRRALNTIKARETRSEELARLVAHLWADAETIKGNIDKTLKTQTVPVKEAAELLEQRLRLLEFQASLLSLRG